MYLGNSTDIPFGIRVIPLWKNFVTLFAVLCDTYVPISVPEMSFIRDTDRSIEEATS